MGTRVLIMSHFVLYSHTGRKIGFIPLMFSGIFGLPYAMPAPTPLNLVVGAPILVPKMEGEQCSVF